jgi:cytoskeletal protein CcmA (bactofilin family)
MSAGSVIGSGSVVRGSVRGEGSLEILGYVEGDVSVTGDVLVGEGSAVRGNITGGKISVLGAVQGDLRGTEAVLIERGGKVAGDLNAPRIGIANGALVRGNVRTEGEPVLTPGAAARRPVATGGPRLAAFPATPRAEAKLGYAEAPDRELSQPAASPPGLVAASPKVAAAAPPKAKDKVAERRPPPPIVPSLGKGARAKKKKERES